MRRIVPAVAGVAVVLAAVAGWWWWTSRAAPGDRGAARVGTAATPAGQPEQPLPDPHARPVEPRVVRGTMLVNDVPVATVGRGTPVFVCLVLEPLQEGTVATMPADARLVVSDAAGRPVAVSWAMVPVTATALEPGRSLLLTWMLSSPLPAGTYRISMAAPVWLDLQGARATGARIAGATLTVTDASDLPRVVAHYERRTLALQGRLDEWLARLEAAQKASPADHAIAGEYVDALDRKGRTADALKALERLASDMQAEQQKARPGVPVELPDWVVFKLAELEARALTKR